jgi:tripartite-type tricarboxylate transporter receptor subunit TctC
MHKNHIAKLWALAAICSGMALAQNYPVKPVRVIDGYPPGGGTDIVARTIAPKFLESQGQTWIIDSRAGAQGIIGTELASKAPPDGYTLLMYTTNFTIHPSIYKSLPYDFLQAFVPVTQTSTVPMILIVHPSVPAHSVKELLAQARSSPGRINYASSGFGGITHMAGELLNTLAKVKMAHIPYKGGAPSVAATLGGEVDLTFAATPVGIPHIRSGRVRTLAVSSDKRSAVIPELPTMAESGVSGYDVTNEYGVVAPAGTPRAIVVKLQQEISRILRLPDVKERLLAIGAEPVGSTPEQFGEHLKNEVAKWERVIKTNRIEMQQW